MVQPVKPEDLPVMKMFMQNSACKKASLAFVRDKEESLHGFVSRDDSRIMLCCQSSSSSSSSSNPEEAMLDVCLPYYALLSE